METQITETATFEQRVDRLANHLLRAGKRQKVAILLAVYRSEFARAEAEKGLEAKLLEAGEKIARVRVQPEGETVDLPLYLRHHPQKGHAIFFIYDIARGGDPAQQYLNYRREFLVEDRQRLLFWLHENEIGPLARNAPDFWAFRGRTLEFLETPLPERLSELANNFAYYSWPRTKTTSKEDLQAGIRLRENLLAELPEGSHFAPNRAELLNALGEEYRLVGNPEKAEQLFKEAIKLDPSNGKIYNNLGMLLKDQSDFNAAQPYLEQALAAFEKAFGSDHPNTARSLNNLGSLFQAEGNIVAARSYFERALKINENSLGPEHPDTAISLNNLGSLLRATGELISARKYYERALEINENSLGPEHPDTATTLSNLGSLLENIGELETARLYIKRALAIREKVLGPNHPDTAQSLNDMGALLDITGNLEAARPFYERALAIREKVLGPNHPDTAQSLNNLGFLLRSAGELNAARTYYERALAIRENTLGPNHPDTAISLNNMGILLRSLHDFKAARLYLERALNITNITLGPDHPNTKIIKNNLETLELNS